MATATAQMMPTTNERIPRSSRRGLRRKKNRGLSDGPTRRDSNRSLCSTQSTESGVSSPSRHQRKMSAGRIDLNVLIRNGSNVVPELAEPGRQASSRSLRSAGSTRRQGTNDSKNSLSSSRSGRSGRSYSTNSLSSLMKRGSLVVPRVEEPGNNLQSNFVRTVSDLSLKSLASKQEGKSSSRRHNDSQTSLGRSAHGSCNSLAMRDSNSKVGPAAVYFQNLDSSDDSPAVELTGPPLVRRDSLESCDGDETQQIDITFDFGGVEDDEDDDSVAARDSVFLSLQDMTAEAAAVTMDSSCWSSSERRPCAASANNKPNRTEMEVSPGVYLPFRDAKETWKAVARGCTIECCCLECGIQLVAIQDCECVVCPDCQMLNPVFDRPADLKTVPHGIGLGLKTELVAEKMAMKRRSR